MAEGERVVQWKQPHKSSKHCLNSKGVERLHVLQIILHKCILLTELWMRIVQILVTLHKASIVQIFCINELSTGPRALLVGGNGYRLLLGKLSLLRFYSGTKGDFTSELRVASVACRKQLRFMCFCLQYLTEWCLAHGQQTTAQSSVPVCVAFLTLFLAVTPCPLF